MTNIITYPLSWLFGITIIRWITALITVYFNIPRYFNIYFTSFALGTLLGNAFVHILPHAFLFNPDPLLIGQMLLVGVLLAFLLEKGMNLYNDLVHHARLTSYTIEINNSINGSIHSALIGTTIISGFLQSTSLGYATGISLGFIGIAQTISSVILMIHEGMPTIRTLIITFITTSFTILAGYFIQDFNISIATVDHIFLPLGAGVFMYEALRKLMPRLQEEKRFTSSIIEIGIMFLGIGLIFLLPH